MPARNVFRSKSKSTRFDDAARCKASDVGGIGGRNHRRWYRFMRCRCRRRNNFLLGYGIVERFLGRGIINILRLAIEGSFLFFSPNSDSGGIFGAANIGSLTETNQILDD